MPERTDINGQDYMVNLAANTSQIGPWIPLAGTWGWSFTVACNGTVAGNLNFQATDFGPQSLGSFPFNAYSTIGADTLSLAISGGAAGRIGRGYDGIWNTPRWLRATWTNSGSAGGATIYVAYTLKRQ